MVPHIAHRQGVAETEIAPANSNFAGQTIQIVASGRQYLRGILYADQHRYHDAITQYERALKINRDTAVIHYRLGQALIRTGAAERARQEFAQFERLHAREEEETAKQTADVQQFVYTLRHSTLAGKE